MGSILRPAAIAFALTGWFLLAVFIFYQYLPTGMSDLAPGIVSVTWGAFLAYVLGVRTYFKRREHELVRQRYLDEGIDRLRAFAEEATRVLQSNVSKISTALAGLCNDNWPAPSPELEVLHLDHPMYLAMLRAAELLGDDVLTSWIIAVSGDVAVSSGSVRDVSDPASPLVEKLRSADAAGAVPALDKCWAEFLEHFHQGIIGLLQGLEYISTVIDRDTTLGWARIDQFRHRPEIRGAMENLAQNLKHYERQDVLKRWREEVAILQKSRERHAD